MIDIMITTKADAVLELIKIREQMVHKGIKIIKSDTYSFVADDELTRSHIYWDGGFIVADINFK